MVEQEKISTMVRFARQSTNLDRGTLKPHTRLIPSSFFLSFDTTEGNRYFRDLIQEHVGPYLAAKTKLEKSKAIAAIAGMIRSPEYVGDFIKKDVKTGRWHIIPDSEARDKVGHAIRKQVQRLQDAKPKLAARLRKEFEEKQTLSETPTKPKATASKRKETVEGKSPTKKRRTKEEPKAEPPPNNIGTGASYAKVGEAAAQQSRSTMPQHDYKIASSRIVDLLHGRNGSDSPALSNVRPVNNVLFPSSSIRGIPSGIASATQAITSGNNYSVYPSLGRNQQRPIDSANLSRLLAQQSYLPPNNSIHLTNPVMMQNLGWSQQALPASSVQNILRAAASIRQQQQFQDFQRLQGLDYARRLAQAATESSQALTTKKSASAEKVEAQETEKYSNDQ